MDKTVKRNRLNKDKPTEKKKDNKELKKEELVKKDDATKKDQLPKDLKPLLTPPDHEIPKHVNDAINDKAEKLQPLIDAQKKLPVGLQQQNKTVEHSSVHEDLSRKHLANETVSSTQVKTNNLNLGGSATKILNQANSTTNSTILHP